jgi:hypothetical protein
VKNHLEEEMIVKKISQGYEFESPTINGAFMVKLTLFDNGNELLETIPMGVPVSYEPRELKSGTIEKYIGTKRWSNFIRMKDEGIRTMFIDP